MDEYGVAVAHKAQQRIALRSLRVFPRRLVGKGAVERDSVELALGILLEATDPHIAEPLTKHGGLHIKC